MRRYYDIIVSNGRILFPCIFSIEKFNFPKFQRNPINNDYNSIIRVLMGFSIFSAHFVVIVSIRAWLNLSTFKYSLIFQFVFVYLKPYCNSNSHANSTLMQSVRWLYRYTSIGNASFLTNVKHCENMNSIEWDSVM